MPSRHVLNIIATVCFVIAAVLLLATGSWIIGGLFAVLAVISIYQVMTGQR